MAMTYAEIHNLCAGCELNTPCAEPHEEITWSCEYDGDTCPTAVEHRRDNEEDEKKQLEARLRTGMDEYDIPSGLREGIVRYVVYHIAPGDFLRVVLQNDLLRAALYADSTNRGHLRAIVLCLYWHAPAACWRSPAAVEAWLKAREDGK